MKLHNLLQIVALTAAGFLISGCNKGLQKTTPLPGWAMRAPGGDEKLEPSKPLAGTPIDSKGLVPMGSIDFKSWVPSAEQPFKSDTVYFEFDKSTIKASETHKLDSIASRMKRYAGKALRIAGHCDERGTEEYNRSLGDRRALAVREYLVRGGVDYQMIDPVSFGEEHPAVQGHNEAAWSKNRRAEFVLLEPPK